MRRRGERRAVKEWRRIERKREIVAFVRVYVLVLSTCVFFLRRYHYHFGNIEEKENKGVSLLHVYGGRTC